MQAKVDAKVAGAWEGKNEKIVVNEVVKNGQPKAAVAAALLATIMTSSELLMVMAATRLHCAAPDWLRAAVAQQPNKGTTKSRQRPLFGPNGDMTMPVVALKSTSRLQVQVASLDTMNVPTFAGRIFSRNGLSAA